MKPVMTMKGDKEAKRMLETVARISTWYKNATMLGHGRDDGENNANIAQYLRDQGRNFFETQSTADAAAKAFAKKTEIVAVKAKRIVSEGGRRNLAGQVWTAAMEAALAAAEKNIKEGNFEGGGKHSLTPDYAARKQKDHGFTMPIGKATGQLLNNLSEHVGNIKLHKT